MHAHTCNCQDRLAASSCYSLGPNGQRQSTVIRHTAAAAQDRHIYPPCLTPPCSSNVLASHSEPRYEVSPLVVVGAGCSSLHRRAHAVLVVLADEDARQLPQSGHVVRLKELALIGSERSHKVLCRGIKSTAEAHKQGRTAAAAPAHFETVMSLVIFLKWIKEGEITLSLFQLQPTRTIYLLIFS